MKILMAEYLEYFSEFKVGNHHYAKMFAKRGDNVLWLSPIYNQLFKIKNTDLYYQRKKLHSNRFIELDKGIYGYAPYSFMLYGNMPFLDTKIANKLSYKMTIPNINKVLKYNSFDDVDILWLTNPKYYYLIENIKYKKLLYRCADDISDFRQTCKTYKYFEEKIIKKADYVFVTANNLIEKKNNIRKDLIYLPNGVELDNFIRERYLIPDEFKNCKKQKCIYVGAVDHWFDVDLVKYCAEKLPNIEFYIIGSIRCNISIIEQFSNVHILGKKDYNDIPAYLYHCDVGIIPFKLNNLTDSITPIKLYEYMSVGLNVVSTNFKEISYIKSPAYISKNYEEFLDNITIALHKRDKDRNIEFAKCNTWEKRFDKIIKYIT
ncbi:glycosyltransferase [Hathewaya histolytica]|uniref:glycosyltransferase n=1 Tax=Hathewaya histolytica TaxID=1498 RepID=UPI003B681678